MIFRSLGVGTLMILAAAGPLSSGARGAAPGTVDRGSGRARIIEDFDDGDVFLVSYPGEDDDSTAWCLDTTNTYNASPYSLKLYGDTWKVDKLWSAIRRSQSAACSKSSVWPRKIRP